MSEIFVLLLDMSLSASFIPFIRVNFLKIKFTEVTG